MKKKTISLLGATGSIGTQALDVIRHTGCAEVAGLSCHSNVSLIEQQVYEFKPQYVAALDESQAKNLRDTLHAFGSKTEVLAGEAGLLEMAAMDGADMVLNALVGNSGLLPTVTALEAGKDIALANKETLVTGGQVIMPLAKRMGKRLLPVDSEHSAIFQCLQNQAIPTGAERLYLTASGGPFRGRTKDELQNVTAAQALRHPNWSMGSKVTIDSSTLMNKGLELIEAAWLFDMQPQDIEVLVHPQSIIHSMVGFADGSIIAQLGLPDMRLPIQYALTYPERIYNNFPRLDFLELSALTFEAPDIESFPCLRLAKESFERGGLCPAVMNAANEVAVELFLHEKIRFLDIPVLIEKAMLAYNYQDRVSLKSILEADSWARGYVREQNR